MFNAPTPIHIGRRYVHLPIKRIHKLVGVIKSAILGVAAEVVTVTDPLLLSEQSVTESWLGDFGKFRKEFAPQ